MNSKPAGRQASSTALILGAALGALTVPALPVIAADATSADQEWRIRELEERVRQEDARREIEQRERSAQEALRSQEEAIRRLEATQQRLQSQSGQATSPAPVTLPSVPVPRVPAPALGAAGTEQRIHELEEWSRQQEALRENSQRVRGQELALRDQEDALRRLEEARRRLEVSTREVAELSSQLGRNYVYQFGSGGAPPRALLGVSIANSSGQGGALVQQVSPGGAAAEAGIKAGDLIVSLAGEDLSKASDPSRALVEKMRGVEPNEKLRLEVMRDGRKLGIDVTPRPGPVLADSMAELTRELGALRQRYNDNHPDVIRLRDRIAGLAQDPVIVRPDGNARFGGMEFATLSERLGSYFGVKQGVLVVRAGENAPFGLQDGDVVLAVDARAPTDAQHLGRILRSYQAGEKVKLRVQRDRKVVELDSTVPGTR